MTEQTATPVTLDGLVESAIARALASDAIVDRVNRAASKAVDSAIDEAFSYGSPFRKMLTEQVQAVLPILTVGDMSVFSSAVREVVQRRLSTLASDTAQQHIGAVLAKLCPDEPVISCGNLRKAFIEKISREEGCGCHEEDAITWEMEGGGVDGYWDLIAGEFDASRYGNSTYTLRFHTLADSRLSECWSVRVPGSKDAYKPTLFEGPLYGFDAMVFRLATGLAKLEGTP